MAAGRRWAQGHDAERQLSFTDSVEHADGQDILLRTGALQYLDYTHPELMQRLRRKPRHVLVNLTPMHPDRSLFTLQNLTIEHCQYRGMSVQAIPEGKRGKTERRE